MKIRNPKPEIRKFLSIVFLVGFFLFSANQVLAACPTGIVPCGTPDCPCTFCDIFKLIHNIINFLLVPSTFNNNIPIIPAIAGLMFVFGGLYLLIAGGRPEMFSKAKTILTATIVGLVIIFLAWVFLNTFFDYIGVAEWTGLGTWWQIECH
jgi:FtsH-binding integral membrane protein